VTGRPPPKRWGASTSPPRPRFTGLSDGIEDTNSKALRDALHRYGGVSIFTPAHLPLGLLPVTRDASGFALTAIRARATALLEIETGAIGARGETLAATRIRFKRGETSAHGHIALPMEVRNATTRLSISGENSAGAVQLLDRARHSAAPVSFSENASGEGQPLLSDVYYLERALSPYAEIAKGGIAQLLDKHVSVLLLADVAKISANDLGKVKDFVSHGGVLDPFCR